MEKDLNQQTEEFLTLLTKNARDIYSIILRVVLNRHDADDIYQETCLVLWREFHQFQIGTNFRLWASRIAMNQILAWRTHLKREKVTFSSAFLEVVSEEMIQVEEDRSEDISDCLSRLSRQHRELIALRYEEQLNVSVLAERVHRSDNAVYRLLQRIREKLFLCLESKKKI